ncbi:minor tail protein [Arthrobacter phage Ingrid]|nr:minor tail protein [Arthrobacter phage Ingrid]QFG11009.1 minor tail protein [Arthrobacter phage Loretta]
MVFKVEVLNSQGSTLALPLGDYSNGYLVKPIDGLDPVDANIVSTSFTNVDGEQHQASRRESRHIIMKLGLKMGMAGSVSSLRSQLMRFFMPKSRIRLRFSREDGPDVDIYAIVERFNCPLFVKEPEATINLTCHQPDFYDPVPYNMDGNTTAGTDEVLLDYNGSVETGFEFKLMVNRSLAQFSIDVRSNEGTSNQLLFTEPLIAGDVLTISTVSGDKRATVTRAGSTSSILHGVTPDSSWLNLFPGPNYIRVSATGAVIPYTITYTSKLGGL